MDKFLERVAEWSVDKQVGFVLIMCNLNPLKWIRRFFGCRHEQYWTLHEKDHQLHICDMCGSHTFTYENTNQQESEE